MSEKSKSDNFLLSVTKGVGVAVVALLLGVLIFAGIVKIATLSSGVIKAVNQFIKAVAVFLGCFTAIRYSKGLFKGACIGVASALIIFLIFAIIGGEVSFGLSFFLDLLFGAIVGALSGVVAVNVKNK